MCVKGGVDIETSRLPRTSGQEQPVHFKCFLLFPDPSWNFSLSCGLLDKWYINFFSGIFPWIRPCGTNNFFLGLISLGIPRWSTPSWRIPVLIHILTAKTTSSQVCSVFDKAVCLSRLSVFTKQLVVQKSPPWGQQSASNKSTTHWPQICATGDMKMHRNDTG